MSGSIKKNKIESIQSLRFIAFLGIFLNHTLSPVDWPALGVSTFYVLSGFLLQTRYRDIDFKLSLKNCACFSLNKIRKLYPLHIAMMLVAIYTFRQLVPLNEMIRNIILNLTLMQTWYPNLQLNISLNGVAWFLSVMMFLYFMFPLIQKTINRIHIPLIHVAIILTVLIIQFLATLAAVKLLHFEGNKFTWFTYFFPIFRMGDFICGCCLAELIKYIKLESKILASIAEVFILTATFFLLKYRNLGTSSRIIAIRVLCNDSTYMIPMAMLWVYAFKDNKGIITRLCSNRLFISLGNISSYLFLTHFLIAGYVNIYSVGSPLDGKRPLLIAISFLLSILASYIWKILTAVVSEKMRMNKVKSDSN